MNIEEKIKQIISESLGIPVNQLTNDAEFAKDLNVTPLEISDLLMGFEKEFNVPISKEESTNFNTVGDVISFLEENSDNYKDHIK
jgi:acyl carrier protein